jgi:hypothetical protein
MTCCSIIFCNTFIHIGLILRQVRDKLLSVFIRAYTPDLNKESSDSLEMRALPLLGCTDIDLLVFYEDNLQITEQGSSYIENADYSFLACGAM